MVEPGRLAQGCREAEPGQLQVHKKMSTASGKDAREAFSPECAPCSGRTGRFKHPCTKPSSAKALITVCLAL